MKHLVKLFIIPLLAFFSCSRQADEWEVKESPTDSETYPVSVSLGKATVEAFAEQGITEVGVYVYHQEALILGNFFPINDGNLSVELPRGINLQTFVIANAGEMINTETLSEVMVRMDAGLQNEIYISDIVDFTSDNSVPNLNLELKRMVGQAVFQPKETADVLNSITQFDQLNLTFTNVGVAYKIQSGECVQEDVTVTTDRAAGFSASVYSLPTIEGMSRTGIDVVYIKNGQEVNRTNSPLDTGIAFEPSKRSIVYMYILEENYLTNEWDSVQGAAISKAAMSSIFTLVESEF